MKDFADLYTLASEFEFSYKVLHQAVIKTFERRRASIPVECPFCFTEAFSKSKEKQTQWAAFLRKNSLTDLPDDFFRIIDRLSDFLLPVLIEPKFPFDAWSADKYWR